MAAIPGQHRIHSGNGGAIMEAFNTDLTQVLKWMHNKAPNIQALINSKNEWYQKYNDRFWSDWERDVFNLDTVNQFGVYVWCEILGIPKEKFVFTPLTNAWAFGKYRQNYKYSGKDTTIPVASRNTVGGNFYGAGNDVVTNLDEARIILKFRYMTLISDGRISSINEQLKYILNDGDEWDFTNHKYMYAIDSGTVGVTGEIPKPDIYIDNFEGRYLASQSPRYFMGPINVDMIVGTAPTTDGAYWGVTPVSGTKSRVAVAAPNGTTKAGQFTTRDDFGSASGFGVGPVNGGSIYQTFNGPNQIITQSVYVKMGTATTKGFGRLRMPGIQPNFSADNQQSYFINQTAIFDFPDDGGDPTISVVGVTIPTGGTYPTDARYAGFKKLANGWYRIWSSIVSGTKRPLAQLQTFGAIQISNRPDQPQDSSSLGNRSMAVWGFMVENIRQFTGKPVEPGLFTFKGTNVSTTLEQTDVVITKTGLDPTATFATPPTSTGYTSILFPGNKAFVGGSWLGYTIPTPYQFATGDGFKKDFPITTPAALQPSYDTPTSMQYRVGSGLGFSAQLINLLQDRSMGILPANAGIPYTVLVT